MDFGTGVFELIQKGGFFVYPIILCSIVGLAIFLQKMWVLQSKNIIPEVFLEQLYRFLSQGKLGEAEVYARANNSSISRVALAALENSNKPKEELREEIEEAGRKETLAPTQGSIRPIDGILPGVLWRRSDVHGCKYQAAR